MDSARRATEFALILIKATALRAAALAPGVQPWGPTRCGVPDRGPASVGCRGFS